MLEFDILSFIYYWIYIWDFHQVPMACVCFIGYTSLKGIKVAYSPQDARLLAENVIIINYF